MALGVLLVAGTASWPVMSAPHIVRRHDREDARYRQLAQRFPAVGRIGYLGEATLIGERWVVTAAHVAAGIIAQTRKPVVRLGGKDYAVVAAYLEPRWEEVGPHDIALLVLATDVPNLAPIRIYRGDAETGDTAYLVGAGASGIGSSRERADDDHMRAATNVVDSADATALYFSFDEPPNGTDLEGAPGSGDSGGPAILVRGGEIFVAGIGAAGFAGRTGPASYGAVNIYTRVTAYAGWIHDVMSGYVEPSWTEGDRAMRGIASSSRRGQ